MDHHRQVFFRFHLSGAIIPVFGCISVAATDPGRALTGMYAPLVGSRSSMAD